MADDVTDVSPAAVARVGYEFNGAADHGDEISADYGYQIDALGDFEGDDEPGNQYRTTVLDPATQLITGVLGAFSGAIQGRGGLLTDTAALYAQSNAAAEENVDGVHVE
jgi:hypothetical protein